MYSNRGGSGNQGRGFNQPGGQGNGQGGLLEQSGTEEVQEGTADELKDIFEAGLKAEDDNFLEVMQNDSTSPLYSTIGFDEIITGPNSNQILQIIDDLYIYQPSRIQCQSIPILNAQKKDLIAQSPSGSGETHSIIISMLLHVDPDKHCPQTICLCHTRELTVQTFKLFEVMNKYTRFTGAVCVNNQEPPNGEAQLIFGIPTSVSYWIKNEKLNVSQVNFLVIDEADAILDKNSTYYPSTVNLLNNLLPKNVQCGFFSSTFKNSIIEHVKKMRPNIITIPLNIRQAHVKTIQHWYTKVKTQNKGFCVIYDLVTRVSKGQTFVFTRSKKLVEEISQFLIDKDVSCKAFSSNLTSQERDKLLDDFRNDEFKVLVCSDVLARGINVPNTFLVINYQTPIQLVPIAYMNQNHGKNERRVIPDCDTYYHRAGRAGRFGKSGLCFTIVTDDRDEQYLKTFCSSLNLNIPLKFIECTKVGALSSCEDESENDFAFDNDDNNENVNDFNNDIHFNIDPPMVPFNQDDNENHTDTPNAFNFNGYKRKKKSHFHPSENDNNIYGWKSYPKIKNDELENDENHTVQELKAKIEKLNRIIDFQNNQIEVLQNDLLEQGQRFTNQIDHMNKKYLQLEKMIKNILNS